MSFAAHPVPRHGARVASLLEQATRESKSADSNSLRAESDRRYHSLKPIRAQEVFAGRGAKLQNEKVGRCRKTAMRQNDDLTSSQDVGS
jgi:hypothetical protein